MNTIYLIYSNPPTSESDPQVQTFRETEGEAKLTVEELTANFHKALTLMDKISNHLKEYDKTVSKLVLEKTIEVPRWKNGLPQDRITDQMLEERNNINQLNSEIIARNRELIIEHSKQRIQSLKSLLVLEDETFLNENFTITEQSIVFNLWLDKSNPFFYEQLNK